MDPTSRPHPDPTPKIQAVALLDELRRHPEWGEVRRASQLDRLIGGFVPEVLLQAVFERFDRLDGGDGEAILRIVEAMGDYAAREALADALSSQPNLAADRTWDALGVLEGTGLIESRPDLMERRTDLEELLGDDETLDELAAEIDSDPNSTWLALQGLSDIEPEIRVEIIAGLAEGPIGVGVVDLLRLLAFAHDPATRNAALSGLKRADDGQPRLLLVWASLATEHPDIAIRDQARTILGQDFEAEVIAWRSHESGRPRPAITSAAVSDLDSLGVGLVVLEAEDRGTSVAAAFRCDVMRGVLEVVGEVDGSRESVRAFKAQVLEEPGRAWLEGRTDLALGLLAGALMLCGPATPPALTFWLERTAGPGFVPRPVLRKELFRADHAVGSQLEQARSVLDALPCWRMHSPLASDLAESIRLRDGDTPPDPRRDPAAYRLLFESEMLHHLERYRRMLRWMECVWAESGRDRLARAAAAIADDLDDPQHAVPGYPFVEQLLSRSLSASNRSELPRQRV